MFEDPNRRAGQAGTQHERCVIQLVAQDKTTLKKKKQVTNKNRCSFEANVTEFISYCFTSGEKYSLMRQTLLREDSSKQPSFGAVLAKL